MFSPAHIRAAITALVLAGGGGLALTVVAGSRVARRPAAPVIKEVVITGAERASEVSLRHLADLREGQSLLVDLDAVVEKVERHPWVDEVSVSRDLTGVVRIAVTEHEPAMLLAYDGLYRVSTDGEIFVRARSSDLDFPVLTGLDRELIEAHAEVGREVLRSALGILGAVDGCEALGGDALSEIHFDRDLGFTLILRGGSRVHMGFGDPAARVARLEAMVRAGLQLDTPHEIDLDMADRALVTPIAS